MAWFHFCTANHNANGRLSLVDMLDWFEAGLLDLGHRVSISHSIVEPCAINVFWECFWPGMAEMIAETGVQYGIVATEIPDGHAFNWQQTEKMRLRFESFLPVAKRASFIWTMVESTVPFYSQFCPTAYVELGFTERLIPEDLGQDPKIDFCFFGDRSPYRVAMIEKLKRQANVAWPEKFLQGAEVANLIARSRIGLSFKQSEIWPVPSPTRLARLMMAKRGVAAEYVPVSTRQGEIAGLCPQGIDFIDYALSMLRSDWRARATEVFERYRTEMLMHNIMEQVLDHTAVNLRSRKRERVKPMPLGFSENLLNGITPRERIEPLGSFGTYNLVAHQGLVLALDQALGEVEVTLGPQALVERYGAEHVIVAESADGARARIEALTLGRRLAELDAKTERLTKDSIALKKTLDTIQAALTNTVSARLDG